MPEATVVAEPVIRGEIHAMFACDAGFQIDLRRAAALLREGLPERVVRLRRPSPAWFDYQNPPLRVMLDGSPLDLRGVRTEPAVECLLYDFGAAVITYTILFEGTASSLVPIMRALYDNAELLADSRGRLGVVYEGVRDAITKPELSEQVDDYIAVCVRHWDDPLAPGPAHPLDLLQRDPTTWARVLLAEAGSLDPAEAERAISARMSYGGDDLAVIDWNAALLIDPEPDDVLAVLRHANVELLEMRLLDAQLDDLLDSAHDLLQRVGRRRIWPSLHDRRLLAQFAEIQTDSVIMFEGVNNAIKLLGDQYLARLYRIAARRLDLPEWDASVLRKIATTESIYEKITDAKSTRRMELLEIIIIVLILISIVMPFIPGLSPY